MLDVSEYENREVVVRCLDGREIKGIVTWSAYADEIDEDYDMLNIEGIGILTNEIESIAYIK